MNENKTKRREWVKNAAIIFLAIMLVLTLFSNTIMNYSLPEVAAQYTNSGTITAKIRGTGSVTASDPYKVTIKDTRTIASVAVQKGDVVEKDQVLFYLEDADSQELKDAEAKLAELNLAFETALLNGDISSSVAGQVQEGEGSSLSEKQAKVESARAKVDSIESSKESYETQLTNINTQLAQIEASLAGDTNSEGQSRLQELQLSLTEAENALNGANDELNTAKAAVDSKQREIDKAQQEADAAYETAKANYDAAVKAYEEEKAKPTTAATDPATTTAAPQAEAASKAAAQDINTVSQNNNGSEESSEGTQPPISTGEDKLAALEAAMNEAEAALTQAESAKNGDPGTEIWDLNWQKKELEITVNNAQAKVNDAQNVYNGAKGNLDTYLSSTNITELNNQKAQLEQQKITVNASVENLTRELTYAQEELAEVIKEVSSELNLTSQLEQINTQKELVEKLRAEATGAQITAPVAGTVSEVNLVAGESTQPDGVLAVIQPSGKGFSLSFSVTNDQAKRLSVGDPAEIANSWYYTDIKATLSKIANDPDNPGKNKILTFSLEGTELQSGQSLSLSVGQKSANYDCIVPNSAIREDNNGKFVLVVESKSSPLGNRYVARRMDVEVLASDDTQSAVSGLFGSEFVITTATKPVEDGKLVRLAEN